MTRLLLSASLLNQCEWLWYHECHHHFDICEYEGESGTIYITIIVMSSVFFLCCVSSFIIFKTMSKAWREVGKGGGGVHITGEQNKNKNWGWVCVCVGGGGAFAKSDSCD